MARRRSISVGWLVLAGMAACAAAASVAYYALSGDLGAPPPEERRAQVKRPVITPAPMPQHVTIYIPAPVGNETYLKPVRVSGSEPPQSTPLTTAMTALVERGQADAAGEVIPHGTRLLSLDVRGDEAVVDLSREFIDNFPGGSLQETLTLNAIAYTAVSNSGGTVSKVRILVGGKPAETLGGHYSLEEPIEPDPRVLAPKSKS